MENENILKARKIDICICIKNRENFVKVIIDILSKITKNIDCNTIFVDGMSNDKTCAKLVDFYNTHKENCIIRQLSENDSTYVNAYNKALNECVSEYVCWLDSDDTCDISKLEVQSKFLDEHQDVDVVSCSTFFGEKKALINSLIELNNEQITKGLENGAGMKEICHFQSCMFRRKCINIFKKNIYFYPEFIGGYAGEGFLYVLHFNGMKFANITNTYYAYSKGLFDDSLTCNIDPLFAKELDSKSYEEKKKEINKLFKKYNK